MIGHTPNAVTLTPHSPHDGREVRMQRTPDVLADQRPTVLRAEDDMHQNEPQRLRHAADYRSGFQPSSIPRSGTWGFTPGWYGPALTALLAMVFVSLLGCHSTPPSTAKPVTQQTATYPDRPSTPAPPFKLFHAANGTFTLVTTPTASDEQIESLIYQLRDAAHTGTFDQLHIPQKAIDARAPTVWFHIYRGPKCAAEKYAPGAPPCGPSYHAAGDYTFGSYKPRDWDEGALVHDEDHQVELWAAGSPYTAPAP